MSNRDFLDAYVYRLDGLHSVDAVKEMLLEMIGELGLGHFVYHGMNMPIPSQRDNYLLLSYPEDWIEHYTGKNYFAIDPVVQESANTLLPLDWANVEKESRDAIRVFGEAGEFGIGKQGLTCPVRGPGGERGLFTVTSDADDAEWQTIKRAHLSDFVVLAQFLHNKVIELEGVRPAMEPPRLGNREKECLKWAASGKTNADIAVILSISEATVRFYLDLARHKLNCLNRTHAVARAIHLGLINGDF